MLDAADLRDRLKRAISQAPTRLTQQAIADECHVSKQAVGGWLRTGRVDKRHFATLSRLTGKPLAYFHGDDSEPKSEDLRPSADNLRSALQITERVLNKARVSVKPEARADIVLSIYDMIQEGHGMQAAERMVSRMLTAMRGVTTTD